MGEVRCRADWIHSEGTMKMAESKAAVWNCTDRRVGKNAKVREQAAIS